MSTVIELPLPYTVVLMRSYRFGDIPEWESEPETDIYVAHVRAVGTVLAVKAAKDEALAADTKQLGKAFMRRMQLDLDEYTFLVMFEGHIKPNLYGFQLPEHY